MVVYRVIEDVYSYVGQEKPRNEYRDYLNGIISVPKQSFNDGINTHDYKNGVRYLHFFHYYEGALEYVSGIPSMGWDGRCFIAFYDIPDEVLNKYRGLGIYPESIHAAVPLLEYAIPFDELSSSYITGEVREYKMRQDYSEEYNRYMQGEYRTYIDNLDDENKRFMKAYIDRR